MLFSRFFVADPAGISSHQLVMNFSFNRAALAMLMAVSVLVATSRADAAPDISSPEYSVNIYLEGIRVAPA